MNILRTNRLQILLLKIKEVSEKNLIKVFPKLIFHNKCSKCGEEVRTRLLSRTGKCRSEDICLNCKFKEYVEHRELNNILADSVAKKAIASQYDDSNAKQFNYQDLNFREKTLLALFLWQVKKVGNVLTPLWKEKNLRIVSDADESYDYFEILSRKNILRASPTSKKTAFNFNEKQEPTVYYIDDVDYILNIKNVSEKSLFFPEVKDDKSIDEFYNCWVELGISVVKQIIYLMIENLDLDDLDTVLARYLGQFTIANLVLLAKEAVYEFYWNQKDAHASSFKEIFVRHIDEALIEKRSISLDIGSLEYTNGYWYNVLFYKVTNLGSDGYEKVPNKDIGFMN